jgi:hypothetical protein
MRKRLPVPASPYSRPHSWSQEGPSKEWYYSNRSSCPLVQVEKHIPEALRRGGALLVYFAKLI